MFIHYELYEYSLCPVISLEQAANYRELFKIFQEENHRYE